MSELRRTPLYEEHKKLGARFVEFGGWEMPVQYSGVINEHVTVRSSAGLFDVSHMGEVRVRGPNAFSTLQYLLSNDLAKLSPGRAQYSVLPNPNGGAVDDVIVYQIAKEDYLICVNASNTEKDFSWISKNNKFGAEIENMSNNFAQLALQGPYAQKILERCLKMPLGTDKIAPFAHQPLEFSCSGRPIDGIVARTGYTGEDGFELYCRPGDAAELWRELLSVGQEFGILPIGLGARDTLRLEAALCLYGHELSDDIDILSAGLGWVTKFEKGDFIGREALSKIKQVGCANRLVGLTLLQPGIARDGTIVTDSAGVEIGVVTSGTKTPTLGKSIALAYLPIANAEIGNKVRCIVRDKPIEAVINPIPFYKRNKVLEAR